MGEAKPLASLSPSLLARKGQAAPAMRRQGMMTHSPQNGHAGHNGHQGDDHFEDLGWNDMGTENRSADVHAFGVQAFAADVPITQPEVPAVVQQHEILSREFAVPALPVPAPVAAEPVRTRAAPGSNGKAAFTLRLDGERHLQLRLVCAVDHRSAQHIVTQALDEFLARQPITNEYAAAKAAANASAN